MMHEMADSIEVIELGVLGYEWIEPYGGPVHKVNMDNFGPTCWKWGRMDLACGKHLGLDFPPFSWAPPLLPRMGALVKT